ncbi:tetratricopeptide repeat protein [Candidatus Roizmanbacteria bacterium]|nr:tetratricopeptide repeat protein [Candidatus Roizmanbacteria bacterium]
MSYSVILLFLVGIIYLPFLGNGFVADDIAGILHNPGLGNFSSVLQAKLSFLRPLLYYLTYHLAGYNPAWFRLPSVMFHAGSVLMVFLLVSRLTIKRIGFLAAALFAVHPLVTESVIWISAGSYPMYSFFFLTALYLYISASSKRKLYIASLLFFILSLLSSEKAVVFPLVLTGWQMVFGKNKNMFRKLAPFYLLSLIYTVLFLGGVGGRYESFRSNYQEVTDYNPFFRIPVAVTTYLELFFSPTLISLYHTKLVSVGEYLVRAAAFLGVVAVLVGSFKKNKYIFFWLGFFLITLIPTLTSFRVNTFLAERYVYLGSVGLFACLGYFLNWFTGRFMRQSALMILTGLIVVLGVGSQWRNSQWRNQKLFAAVSAGKSPLSVQPHLDLAAVYSEEKNYKSAQDELKQAIELFPTNAEYHEKLGDSYFLDKRYDLAFFSYKQALQIDPGREHVYENMKRLYAILNISP